MTYSPGQLEDQQSWDLPQKKKKKKKKERELDWGNKATENYPPNIQNPSSQTNFQESTLPQTLPNQVSFRHLKMGC